MISALGTMEACASASIGGKHQLQGVWGRAPPGTLWVAGSATGTLWVLSPLACATADKPPRAGSARGGARSLAPRQIYT